MSWKKQEVISVYRKHRGRIREILDGFSEKGGSSREDIFAELLFCILTPQSRAIAADEAVRRIRERGLLFSTDRRRIRACLSGVRFPNNKAGYICGASRIFGPGGTRVIKELTAEPDTIALRSELCCLVKGIGLKEASHFLRNIGRGEDIAILDRHILRGLAGNGVISSAELGLTGKRYAEIEDRMREYSRDIGVPLDALDLVLWYMKTGYFFK